MPRVCVSYLGVSVGLDAQVESRRGRRVGPQVDDDGPGGVEPLQGALGAAEVDLLHVPAVRLVAQAAAGRGEHSGHKVVRFQHTEGI